VIEFTPQKKMSDTDTDQENEVFIPEENFIFLICVSI